MVKEYNKLVPSILLILGVAVLSAQKIDPTGKSYIRVGSLQSHISAYGAERAWNESYYEGLIWPADYLYQDNAVIKRSFLAAKDWVDGNGYTWEYWATNISLGTVDISIFPVKLEQSSKFEQPIVIVDGNNLTAPFLVDIDVVNSDQIPDRIVTNTVNTVNGLTITRRVLAFSQQYHDNYFIKEIIITNTGNKDYDDEIELTEPIYGFRIGWSTRYSVSRDGAWTIGDGSQKWGKHSWVTKRGEDYANHQGEVFTELDGVQDWLRAGFCYLGQDENTTAYSTIGAPYITKGGYLASPHHVGTAILHVPKSANDSSDDVNQPVTLGWHAGDTWPPGTGTDPAVIPALKKVWDFLAGVPYGGDGMGGLDRFDETYMTTPFFDPYTVHNDGGGTNLWIGYGPFDLEHGESITIVEVEGIAGLDRQKCIEVGRKWKKAKDDPSTTYDFEMPNGSIVSGSYNNQKADEYKNAWVFTGKDSIMQTFGRAYRNYMSGYNIPQPPSPPKSLEVNSGGDRISLSWTPSDNDGDDDFAGYRIYRAEGKPDTVHTLLDTLAPGENVYHDVTAIRGFNYYYYITAVNDGSNNASAELNPSGPLESSRFYTKTTEPATLKRKQGTNLDQIVIVPNPYNIQAKDIQFGSAAPDQIMFYEIPGKCFIKIYSERGDLIETLKHDDGSGDEAWNCMSSSRQVVVSGLYIVYFEVSEDIYENNVLVFTKGESTYRKLIVIR